MVTNNGKDQSQDVNLSDALNAGAESSQQNGAGGGEDQSGAGTGPGETKTEPRTYSEEEVGKIQSSGDKQVAEANKLASNAVMMLQKERAERQERDAQSTDAADVDSGDLTAEGAKQRANQRESDRTNEAQRLQQTAETERALSEAEPVLRKAMALELATKYGVDAETLENDPKATTPDRMEDRAEVLAAEKKVKELTPAETFDGGASGIGGSAISFSDMTPMEKIIDGLSKPAPKT